MPTMERAARTADFQAAVLRLELRLEASMDMQHELRAQLASLQLRYDELVDRAMGRRGAPSHSTPPAAATSTLMPTGPVVGPHALAAISAFSGRNRALGQELMEAALDELRAHPEITDVQLAAKIVEGESPEMLDDDEELAAGANRIIPG